MTSETKQSFSALEVARRNMVAFAEHFTKHMMMSRDEWFEIQRNVLDKFKKELEE